MNAKDEIIEIIKELSEDAEDPVCVTIKCAHITYKIYGPETKVFILKEGYSGQEVKDFFNSLDFEYSNSKYSVDFIGTIWLSDDSYIRRTQCETVSFWERISKMPIPDFLKKHKP